MYHLRARRGISGYRGLGSTQCPPTAPYWYPLANNPAGGCCPDPDTSKCAAPLIQWNQPPAPVCDLDYQNAYALALGGSTCDPRDVACVAQRTALVDQFNQWWTSTPGNCHSQADIPSMPVFRYQSTAPVSAQDLGISIPAPAPTPQPAQNAIVTQPSPAVASTPNVIVSTPAPTTQFETVSSAGNQAPGSSYSSAAVPQTQQAVISSGGVPTTATGSQDLTAADSGFSLPWWAWALGIGGAFYGFSHR